MTEPIIAIGSFEIDLQPANPVVADTGRLDFTKTWSGEIAGESEGVMLSAGDPSTGTAGYVAIETFNGTIAGRAGSLAFQQFGTMLGEAVELRYEIVPGSGSGELTGLVGAVTLNIVDGVHEVELEARPVH